MDRIMTLHWEGSFDSAHKLYEYDGKCGNLHGHRWTVKVDIRVQAWNYAEDGVSVDFNVLKSIVGELDHKYLNEDIEEFKTYSPSAENIVQYLADRIHREIQECKGFPVLKRIELFETPHNSVVLEFA